MATLDLALQSVAQLLANALRVLHDGASSDMTFSEHSGSRFIVGCHFDTVRACCVMLLHHFSRGSTLLKVPMETYMYTE